MYYLKIPNHPLMLKVSKSGLQRTFPFPGPGEKKQSL